MTWRRLALLYLVVLLLFALDRCNAQELPDAPHVSKLRAVEFVALSGSASFDIEATVRGYPGGFGESNPLLRALGGPQPSRAVMYSAIGSIDAGIWFGSGYLERHGHSKLGHTLTWAAIAVHVAGGVKSLVDQHNQPPSPPGYRGTGR